MVSTPKKITKSSRNLFIVVKKKPLNKRDTNRFFSLTLLVLVLSRTRFHRKFRSRAKSNERRRAIHATESLHRIRHISKTARS